jgi:hypothetical protein
MADEKKPPVPPAGPQIQVQLDEAIAQGVYSNFVLINHAENEFILDFAFMAAGTPAAKVRARIVSAPRHTKRLLRALQQNIARYEERFGEIEIEETLVH